MKLMKGGNQMIQGVTRALINLTASLYAEMTQENVLLLCYVVLIYLNTLRGKYPDGYINSAKKDTLVTKPAKCLVFLAGSNRWVLTNV
jgi:hypothetical protein